MLQRLFIWRIYLSKIVFLHSSRMPMSQIRRTGLATASLLAVMRDFRSGILTRKLWNQCVKPMGHGIISQLVKVAASQQIWLYFKNVHVIWCPSLKMWVWCAPLVSTGCLRPLIPPHSYMNISETLFSVPVGTVVHYQCFPGYKLEGPELLECMYNLIWSDTPPLCLDVEGKYH